MDVTSAQSHVTAHDALDRLARFGKDARQGEHEHHVGNGQRMLLVISCVLSTLGILASSCAVLLIACPGLPVWELLCSVCAAIF